MEEWGGVIGAAAGEASDSMKEPLLGSRGGGGGSGGRLEERGGDYEEDEEGEGELDPHVVEQYYSKVQNGRLYLAVLSTALGPLSLGLTLGYSSPAIPDLERSPEAQLRLSPAQVSWFGSLVTIGAVLAGPLAGLLVERLGRKPTLMLSAVPFVVGWLLLVTAQSPAALYAGRTLTGLAGGTASLVVPVYISEVSHPAVRGALGSCMQLMVVLGIFTAYAAGLILGWRWLAVLCAVPPTLMLLLLVAVVPESPRFLLSRPRRRAEAVAALTVLRGDAVDVRTEIRLIRQGQQQQQQERLSWRELRMPVLYKPLAVTVLLMTLQQFSGINAVMLYAESIFRAAHIQCGGARDYRRGAGWRHAPLWVPHGPCRPQAPPLSLRGHHGRQRRDLWSLLQADGVGRQRHAGRLGPCIAVRRRGPGPWVGDGGGGEHRLARLAGARQHAPLHRRLLAGLGSHPLDRDVRGVPRALEGGRERCVRRRELDLGVRRHQGVPRLQRVVGFPRRVLVLRQRVRGRVRADDRRPSRNQRAIPRADPGSL
ncbi:solute carrier family 2, facilitated glucose transporter member 8 isoform X3 [Lampetra fluviatilis]